MKIDCLSRWLCAVAIGCVALTVRAAQLPSLPGELDATFETGTGANAVVMDLALDGDKILIGGQFTDVNGVPRSRVARLHANGSLDTTFVPFVESGLDGFVWTLAVQDNGYVVIGGQFAFNNGATFAAIARLDPNGTQDPAFNPGDGPNGAVSDIVLQPDGRILIGGEFQLVNGVPARFVARLNVDGTPDTTFDTSVGAPTHVRALALQPDGKVLVGGNYFVLRLNPNGSIDPGFASTNQLNSVVETIVVQNDGRVLIGGQFGMINGVGPSFIARLLGDGTVDNTFNPGVGPNSGVIAMALQPDGRIVIGGGFSTVNGRQRSRIARLHPDGRLDGIFLPTPGANDWIEAVALQSDGRIVIGGNFTTVNLVNRNHIARLNGADPTPFVPVILSAPSSQTVNEGMSAVLRVDARGFPEPTFEWQFQGAPLPGATEDVLVLNNVRLSSAGDYRVEVSNTLGSTSAVATVTVIPAPTHAGALDLNFLADLRFTNSTATGTVSRIAVRNDDKIVFGGSFHLVNGVARDRVARLEPNGNLDPAFIPGPGSPGAVNVLALQEDKVLAGSFGDQTIKRLTSVGALDGTFVGPFSPIGAQAMAVQNDGKVLVSGYFGGRYLVRLNPNGALDPEFVSAPGPSGTVHAIAVQPDGKIVIAGEFVSVDAVPRNRLARLQSNGTLDPSFDPGAGAVGGTSFINEYGDRTDRTAIFAVLLQADGRLLIGGDFTKVDAMARHRVARLTANGSLDLSFDPGPGPNNSVLALALQADGKVLLGGNFTTINSLPRPHVGRLQADGSLDLTFDPLVGPNGSVRAVTVLNDGAVLIGGDFTTVNGVPRTGLARLFGGDPPGFGPTILAGPTSTTVHAGEDVTFSVLAAGVPPPTYQWQFNGVDIPGANSWILTLRDVRTAEAGTYGVLIRNPFAVTPSPLATLTVQSAPRQPGAVDIDFYTGLGPNDVVYAIAVQPDGKILIGGAFTEVDGTSRGRIARLEHSGSVDRNFDPGLGADGVAYAVTVQQDGRVLMGGAFTKVDDVPASCIVRLNGLGGLDPSFNTGAGANAPVLTIALDSEERILIGGRFTFVRGSSRPGLARLTRNGDLDSTFVPALTIGTTVTDLAVQPDGKILVAGWLVGANGVLLSRVARANPDGNWDPSFSPESAVVSGFAGSVFSLALEDNGSAWIGGSFEQYRGVFRTHLARLNPDGTLDPRPGPGEGPDGFVHAIALQADGKPVIGGRFLAVTGRPLSGIARLETNGLVDATFNPGTGVTGGTLSVDEYGSLVDLTAVLAIAVEPDGRLLIGGDFSRVNGVTRPYLARLYDHEPSSRIEIRALTSPAGMVELLWEIGVLEQAPQLDGPWTDVPGAASPQRVVPQGAQRFYRLRVN